MSAMSTLGIRIPLPSQERREPLTAEQLRNRRNEDWRLDHEVGRPNPATGQLEKRPVKLIAALARVPERTIRHGIAEARKLREAIAACV